MTYLLTAIASFAAGIAAYIAYWPTVRAWIKRMAEKL
jgi:hypothetical protein